VAKFDKSLLTERGSRSLTTPQDTSLYNILYFINLSVPEMICPKNKIPDFDGS